MHDPDISAPAATTVSVEVTDARATSQWGLSAPAHITQPEGRDGAVMMSSGTAPNSGFVIAHGAPAALLRSIATRSVRGSSVPWPAPDLAGHAPPPPTTMAEAAPQLAPPPNEGENPLAWLTRTGQTQAIHDWVMTQGLAGGQSREWAAFASAMGWELALPPAPPPPQGPTNDSPPEAPLVRPDSV